LGKYNPEQKRYSEEKGREEEKKCEKHRTPERRKKEGDGDQTGKRGRMRKRTWED
jgi:hypothetical protein